MEFLDLRNPNLSQQLKNGPNHVYNFIDLKHETPYFQISSGRPLVRILNSGQVNEAVIS